MFGYQTMEQIENFLVELYFYFIHYRGSPTVGHRVRKRGAQGHVPPPPYFGQGGANMLVPLNNLVEFLSVSFSLQNMD